MVARSSFTKEFKLVDDPEVERKLKERFAALKKEEQAAVLTSLKPGDIIMVRTKPFVEGGE